MKIKKETKDFIGDVKARDNARKISVSENVASR